MSSKEQTIFPLEPLLPVVIRVPPWNGPASLHCSSKIWIAVLRALGASPIHLVEPPELRREAKC